MALRWSTVASIGPCHGLDQVARQAGCLDCECNLTVWPLIYEDKSLYSKPLPTLRHFGQTRRGKGNKTVSLVQKTTRQKIIIINENEDRRYPANSKTWQPAGTRIEAEKCSNCHMPKGRSRGKTQFRSIFSPPKLQHTQKAPLLWSKNLATCRMYRQQGRPLVLHLRTLAARAGNRHRTNLRRSEAIGRAQCRKPARPLETRLCCFGRNGRWQVFGVKQGLYFAVALFVVVWKEEEAGGN